MATAKRPAGPTIEAPETVDIPTETLDEIAPESFTEPETEPVMELTLEEAQAQARAARAEQSSKKRTVKVGRRLKVEIDADVPWPEMDFEAIFPTSYFAVIDKLGETLEETEFHIDDEKLVGIAFSAPDGNIAVRSLYVVKAVQPDGRIIQIPFEEQINNTAAGDREDALGLRRYERRGIALLWDWANFLPIFCAHVDCWARAMVEELSAKYPQHRRAANTGFCSLRHQARTLPNMFDDAGNIRQGLMSQGATTTRIWKA